MAMSFWTTGATWTVGGGGGGASFFLPQAAAAARARQSTDAVERDRAIHAITTTSASKNAANISEDLQFRTPERQLIGCCPRVWTLHNGPDATIMLLKALRHNPLYALLVFVPAVLITHHSRPDAHTLLFLL